VAPEGEESAAARAAPSAPKATEPIVPMSPAAAITPVASPRATSQLDPHALLKNLRVFVEDRFEDLRGLLNRAHTWQKALVAVGLFMLLMLFIWGWNAHVHRSQCADIADVPPWTYKYYSRANWASALNVCRAASERTPSSAHIQYLLGRALMWNGENLIAVGPCKLAADRGDAGGMTCMGLLYGSSNGVKTDYRQAMKWYQMAANRGDTNAMTEIGNLYYDGRGVEVNYQEAMKWWRMGADKGDAISMHNVGALYDSGKGTDQDHQQAMKWYRLAAEKGDPESMNELGLSYARGTGVETDDQEAMKWFRKSADKGYSVGMLNVGWLYHNGQGVTSDDQEARRWFLRAEELSPGIAADGLASLDRERYSSGSSSTSSTSSSYSSSGSDIRDRIQRKQCDMLYSRLGRALSSPNSAVREMAEGQLRNFGCL